MKPAALIVGCVSAVGAALYGWATFDGTRSGKVTQPVMGYATAATFAAAAFLLIRGTLKK